MNTQLIWSKNKLGDDWRAKTTVSSQKWKISEQKVDFPGENSIRWWLSPMTRWVMVKIKWKWSTGIFLKGLNKTWGQYTDSDQSNCTTTYVFNVTNWQLPLWCFGLNYLNNMLTWIYFKDLPSQWDWTGQKRYKMDEKESAPGQTTRTGWWGQKKSYLASVAGKSESLYLLAWGSDEEGAIIIYQGRHPSGETHKAHQQTLHYSHSTD